MISVTSKGKRRMTKYARVAATVRAQIEDGEFVPGELAPSGAELARQTGYSVLTCRRALRVLVEDGMLTCGLGPSARPRVPIGTPSGGGPNLADAKRALSVSLAARRRAAGLTQPQLAEMVDRSVTSVGHAETGRVWQSRLFWELADKAVNAGGELVTLYDAYLAATAIADAAVVVEEAATEGATDDSETIMVAASERTANVTITWADGAVTTVYAPRSPSLPSL